MALRNLSITANGLLLVPIGNDMQVQHELDLYEHLLVFWVV